MPVTCTRYEERNGEVMEPSQKLQEVDNFLVALFPFQLFDGFYSFGVKAVWVFVDAFPFPGRSRVECTGGGFVLILFSGQEAAYPSDHGLD